LSTRLHEDKLIFDRRKKYTAVAAVFLVVFGATRSWERQQSEILFKKNVDRYIQAIAAGIDDKIQILVALQAFFDASTTVTREEFKIFNQPILKKIKAVQTLEWVPRVPAAEREAYEAAAREQGYADFQFWEYSETDARVPAAARSEYFPIYYVEPYESNEPVMGFDMASRPRRWAAMNKAREFNEIMATEKLLKPLQGTPDESTVLFLAPVFDKQGKNELKGFVLSVFHIAELVQDALKPYEMDPAINLCLNELTDAGQWERLYCTGDDSAGNIAAEYGHQMMVAGRLWKVKAVMKPDFVKTHSTGYPWGLFAAGLVLTSVGCLYLYSVMGRGAAVEALVENRTKELTVRFQRYRSIVANIPGAIYRCANDKDWTMEFISDKINDISGYPASDFINNRVRSYASIIHPEDVKYVDDVIQTGVREKKMYALDYRIVDASGRIRWVYEKGQGVYDELGNLEWLDRAIFDITERKTAEEKIHKLSTAVDQGPMSVVITDVRGDIEYVNRKFETLTGYSLKEAMGKNPRILKSDTQSRDFYEQMWKTISSGNAWVGEMHNKKKNGELYWELVAISPLKNEKKEITHYIGVKEDITARKNAEEKLLRFNRLMQEFVSHVSHESKNPIVVIREVLAQLLDGVAGEISERQRNLLEMGKRSTGRLLRLVTDLLDLSKIESGKLSVKYEEIDAVPFLDEVATSFQQRFKVKDQTLVKEWESAPVKILADRDKLTEILVNLITNASKYTPAGGKVGIQIKTSPDEIRFEIWDTGPGISDEDKDKIFDKYERIKQRDSEGAGLGLAITKELVVLHCGEIWVESEPGKGSRFIFTFPQAWDYFKNHGLEGQ